MNILEEKTIFRLESKTSATGFTTPHTSNQIDAAGTCKACCINASWSKYVGAKRRKLSKKCKLNENRGKFIYFAEIEGIYIFGK